MTGSPMKFNDQQAEIISELLKSIAHPIRMKILCFLMEGEKNVGEIEQQFGSTISNISQHLTVLRKAKIFHRRKEANFIFYTLTDNNVQKLMEILKNNFC